MTKRPFFSLILPTRDRPDLLRYCLKSIRNQDFGDYEVIIADNSVKSSADHVFAEFADARFRYVKPDRPLSMPDNWEFGVSFARGRYVSVVIDKTVLMPTALSFTAQVLSENPAEIASWRSDIFTPKDERKGYDVGTFVAANQQDEVSYFLPQAELDRRFSLVDRRGYEKEKYFLGKICFGVFEDALINRIKKQHGRIFFPLSPDYTSMVLGLAYARGAIDLGRSLQISFSVSVSNGRHTQVNPDASLDYLRTIDPKLEILNTAPIAGLYSASHNLVCYDYLQMQSKVKISDHRHVLNDMRLNAVYLLVQCYEDLRGMEWNNLDAKAEQYQRLKDFSRCQKIQDRWRFVALIIIKRFGEHWYWAKQHSRDVIIEILAKALARTPRVKAWAKRVGYRTPVFFVQETDSILTAADLSITTADSSNLKRSKK